MALRNMARYVLVLGMMAVASLVIEGMQPTDKTMVAVDLNRANIAELVTVPGMTEVWAKRIVRFRPYRRKTDLVDHGVISAEEYGKIRDFVVAHRATQESDNKPDTK